MNLARFDEAPQRPLWLITLADLSLLLLGFFVFLQASASLVDGRAMARGLREAFGGQAAAIETEPAAMALDLAVVGPFAANSALLPADDAAILAWVRDAVRDPRTSLTLTGTAMRNGDVDPDTGSADILAVDRARAVAASLVAQGAIAPGRIRFNAPARAARAQVTLAVGFAGDPIRKEERR